MAEISLTIDGRQLTVPAGASILEVARGAGIYIPTLCHHPDLPPAEGSAAVGAVFQGTRRIANARPQERGRGCGLCVVEVEGSAALVSACATAAADGMVVRTSGDRVQAVRREKLMPILSRHPHGCLTCTQQAGCSRSQCSLNVPQNERCCPQFGHCELQQAAEHVGILPATPRWVPTGTAVILDRPLFRSDHSLCIGCTRCVRACRDLRGIEAIGFVFDAEGKIQVGTLAESLEASGCRFCTACVAVCPTGALTDKGIGVGTREEDLVPCRAACPAGIDVPAYVRMIAHGRREEAHAIIRERVPFVGVLGRVCTRPCETVCRRGALNEPVAICALKRHAADGGGHSGERGAELPAPSGRQVAVVGAGPAGLTAAFYLRRKGHAVTVFDSQPAAGGMMRFGIPEHRLPRSVLEREVQAILDLGVEFRPRQTLGVDFTLESLRAAGFDAVFLALGAQLSRRIALEGCSLPDVLWGVDFLRRVARGEAVAIKETLVVIGGGSVAVDAAMTALRCGAVDVTLVCLESQDDMPAGPWAVEAARAEGVRILPSWGPARIAGENGRITAIDLLECTCVLDERGNFRPRFGDRRECLRADQVVLALGQSSDLSCLCAGGPVAVECGRIVVDRESLETGLPGVYAGGDVAAAPGSVVYAVAAGRKAAASIDRALGGDGRIDPEPIARGEADPRLGRAEGFALLPRVPVAELDPALRRQCNREISLGYTGDQARQEAARCLQCDLRLQLKCNPAPPESAMAFDRPSILQAPESEGVFQLLDADGRVLSIKGAANLRQELLRALADGAPAARYKFVEDAMYSRRESELLQAYVQQHGAMPGGKMDELY
jgi:NADPH-dependent glutamate synthase beta subunit-like oxidoreductase